MQPIKEAHIRKSCLGNMVRIDWDRGRNTFIDTEGKSVEDIDRSNGKPGLFRRNYVEVNGELVCNQVGVIVDGVNVPIMKYYVLSRDFRVSPGLDGETVYTHPVTFYEPRR